MLDVFKEALGEIMLHLEKIIFVVSGGRNSDHGRIK